MMRLLSFIFTGSFPARYNWIRLDSNLVKVEGTAKVEIFWSFFLQQRNGSTCAMYRDIIQMRWKTFNDFAANLFRKLRTKFYQNRRNFIEEITRCFFLTVVLSLSNCSTCTGLSVCLKIKLKLKTKHFGLFFWTECLYRINTSGPKNETIFLKCNSCI